ncbi:protein kinase [Polyangium aurulentum]|nr:protein kinase [Polyangium aurulentum]
MGYVVEAKHIALDERVALKFLLPEYAKHPEAATRFLREARAAKKIKSEHVARVSDVGELDGGAPYMEMEFLDGVDLARLLKDRGVLSVPDAIDYILQACEALAEAHSYGIVHRDIKPANLFLTKRPDGTPLVKVLDFGISKMMSSGENALTRTSTAMGSALYMSPEQMQETRAVDHRTDIYSLGIALFELLAGKQPFYAETLPQLCAEVLTGTPSPLRSFRPDVPEDLALRIELAFERDRSRRYQSIAELALGLAPYAPARAQGSIDRVARMAGMTPLAAGQPAPIPIPHARASSPSLPAPQATATPLSPTLPTSVQAETALLPAAPAPREGSSSDLLGARPAAEVQINAPPVADRLSPVPAVPAPRRKPTPPTPDMADAEPNRIVADSYDGPMSVNAAAAFASSAHKARLEQQQQNASGRALLITALVLGGLLGIGGGVAVFALRDQAEMQHDEHVKPAAIAPAEPRKPATPDITVRPSPDPLPSATTAVTSPSASAAATVPAGATVPGPGAGGRAPRPAPTPGSTPKPSHGSSTDVFDDR